MNYRKTSKMYSKCKLFQSDGHIIGSFLTKPLSVSVVKILNYKKYYWLVGSTRLLIQFFISIKYSVGTTFKLWLISNSAAKYVAAQFDFPNSKLDVPVSRGSQAIDITTFSLMQRKPFQRSVFSERNRRTPGPGCVMELQELNATPPYSMADTTVVLQRPPFTD